MSKPTKKAKRRPAPTSRAIKKIRALLESETERSLAKRVRLSQPGVHQIAYVYENASPASRLKFKRVGIPLTWWE